MPDIDMTKIAMIESNNNPFAYNKQSGARGKYQLTPITLNEWNRVNKQDKHKPDDLFNEETNTKIGTWYMNWRIPEMYSIWGIPDTPEIRLIGYNWGPGNTKAWYKNGADYKKLPKETQQYLEKYFK